MNLKADWERQKAWVDKWEPILRKEFYENIAKQIKESNKLSI